MQVTCTLAFIKHYCILVYCYKRSFKRRVMFSENFFIKQSYHDCHTRFAVFFSPSCCLLSWLLMFFSLEQQIPIDNAIFFFSTFHSWLNCTVYKHCHLLLLCILETCQVQHLQIVNNQFDQYLFKIDHQFTFLLFSQEIKLLKALYCPYNY